MVFILATCHFDGSSKARRQGTATSSALPRAKNRVEACGSARALMFSACGIVFGTPKSLSL